MKKQKPLKSEVAELTYEIRFMTSEMKNPKILEVITATPYDATIRKRELAEQIYKKHLGADYLNESRRAKYYIWLKQKERE